MASIMLSIVVAKLPLKVLVDIVYSPWKAVFRMMNNAIMPTEIQSIVPRGKRFIACLHSIPR